MKGYGTSTRVTQYLTKRAILFDLSLISDGDEQC